MVTDPMMENEVKLTVIATGFPNSEGNPVKEAATAGALKELLGDSETLDIPPFLRNHRAARRHQRTGVTVGSTS